MWMRKEKKPNERADPYRNCVFCALPLMSNVNEYTQTQQSTCMYK